MNSVSSHTNLRHMQHSLSYLFVLVFLCLRHPLLLVCLLFFPLIAHCVCMYVLRVGCIWLRFFVFFSACTFDPCVTVRYCTFLVC